MKTLLIVTAVFFGTPANGESDMKENLKEGLEIILEHEGLYSDDPKDNGGATMRGVTQKVYENYVDRPVSKDEMKTLCHIAPASLAQFIQVAIVMHREEIQ